LLIWDLVNQQIIGTFRVGQGIPTGIRYSNDGKVLATSGFNGMVRLQQTDKIDNLFSAGLTGIAQNIAFLGTNRFAMITASDTVSLYTRIQYTSSHPRTRRDATVAGCLTGWQILGHRH
jgi:hypothetical protein